MSFSTQLEEAAGPTLTVIRSKKNPDYIKIAISGRVGRVDVKGETLPVHLGIDNLDSPKMDKILPDTKLHRANDTLGGSKIPFATLHKVRKAVEAKLRGLK